MTVLGSLTRRAFLHGTGLGALALRDLLRSDRGDRRPHHAPRARAVIWLGMVGAPSQLDLFDYKPELVRRDGEPMPASLLEGERFAFLGDGKQATLLAPRWRFERAGANGTWLSELLPHHRAIADRVCWIHSLHTDEINHVPAQLLLHTGSPRMGRPTAGSWITWGLGTANEDLPGFVVLASGKAGRCGTACWSSGFLPSRYQGVQLRTDGEPVLFLSDPPGVDRTLRAHTLETLRNLNDARRAVVGDPEIDARTAQFELAFRMQASVPDLVDLSREPQETLALYGVEPDERSFAGNCLLARRLVERGVRFVQLVHGGFDHHGGTGDQNLLTDLPNRCRQVDRGAAALVLDLERRGLLDDVVVVFAGEFGRTPMLQGPRKPNEAGRDHQRTAFTGWLAGAGLRRGLHHGATDELGFRVVADPVHVHDLQATLLHLLGIDHERLVYRFQGRDFRLTDVAGRVVEELLA